MGLCRFKLTHQSTADYIIMQHASLNVRCEHLRQNRFRCDQLQATAFRWQHKRGRSSELPQMPCRPKSLYPHAPQLPQLLFTPLNYHRRIPEASHPLADEDLGRHFRRVWMMLDEFC
jgi:hypothetical protein